MALEKTVDFSKPDIHGNAYTGRAAAMMEKAINDFKAQGTPVLDTPQAVEKIDVLQTRPLRINLGCRDTSIPGFLNVDIVEHFNPDIVDDAVTLASFQPDSVEIILASHVLEHLDDPGAALLRWIEIIQPGGALIAYMPNFPAAVELWKEGKSFDGLGDPLRGFLGVATGHIGYQHLYDNQAKGEADTQTHKQGFSPSVIVYMLMAAGFVNIQLTQPNTEFCPRNNWEFGVFANKPAPEGVPLIQCVIQPA